MRHSTLKAQGAEWGIVQATGSGVTMRITQSSTHSMTIDQVGGMGLQMTSYNKVLGSSWILLLTQRSMATQQFVMPTGLLLADVILFTPTMLAILVLSLKTASTGDGV